MIKYCPFCGYSPKIVKFEYDYKDWYAVVCDCEIMDRSADYSTGQGWATEAEAIEAWNERENS